MTTLAAVVISKLDLVSIFGFAFDIAKLSQAPAPAGLSLALFPNYPATRPGRPDPADPTRPGRPELADPTGMTGKGFFFRQYLNLYLMQFSHNQAQSSSMWLD